MFLLSRVFSFRLVPAGKHRREGGYILLTLMLVVTLLAIAAAAVAPSIVFEVRRDREEELIHRGVQYSRAVKRYFKKFGRYPTRLEDLENTNNLRFLRKRYKDPVTGKDFKLLHVGDVQLTFGAGIAGAVPAGVNPGVGISPVTAGNLGAGGAAAASQAFSLLASAQQPQQQPQQGFPGNTDGGQEGAAGGPDNGQGAPGNGQPPNAGGFASSNNLSSQVFGGGPIVGVVSTSKDQTIREFNKKNHYDKWQFIYDPSTDRGGLLNTPAQPPLQVAAQPGQQPGAPGSNPGGFQNQQPQQPQPPSNQPPEPQ